MKTLGVIGFPLKHSISPQMHMAAINELGIDFEYFAYEITPENLQDFVARIKRDGIVGINVTIPHKENIIKFLDIIDESVKTIGAVNTVLNRDGELSGYNTDCIGFIDSLKFDTGFNPAGKKAVLLGCGGAARAIAVALCKSNISELVLHEIITDKAKSLQSHLKRYFSNNVIISGNIGDDLQGVDLVINATPSGMLPNVDEIPVPNPKFNKNQLVFDIIYNPQETKLLKVAREYGAKTINGIDMFVRQGASSFKIFTGHNAPIDVMKKAVLASLNM